MKLASPKRAHRFALIFLITVVFVASLVAGRVSWSRNSRGESDGHPLARPGHAAPRTTSGPTIYLADPLPLAATNVGEQSIVAALENGAAQPLSLVATDLDADGVQDLVAGYSTREGGILTVRRGNLDAFAPQNRESFEAIGRGDFPSPFLPDAKAFAVPVHPDFVAEGSYNPYGYRDLIVAARGDNSIYLLSNDGRGNFSAPRIIRMGGAITAVAVGNFGKSSAFSKLLVGVCDESGSSFRVYEGAVNAVSGVTVVPLSSPATNLFLDESGVGSPDAFFISNGKVSILHSSSMRLETVSLPINVVAFSIGSFIYDRNGTRQIALLASDGSIDVAAQRQFDPHVLTVAEMTANRRAALDRRPNFAVSTQPMRREGWKVVEHIPTAVPFRSAQKPVLFRTRVSDQGADDLLILNPATGQLIVVAHPDGHPGDSTFRPARISIRPYSDSAIAGLSMRVNIDGRPGVIALHQNQVAPSVMMPLPDPTFFVNKTTDPAPTSPIANACNNVSNVDLSSSCSLREAVLKANATAGTDTIQLAAGTYTLTRGRIASPAYDAVTGTLNINDSVNIVGTVDGSGNPNSIITWGTLTNGLSVDMVMAVNEDISPLTNATASISNVVIQNGINHGTHSLDGDGGCMEYDTGTSGNANLTLTNVTLQNCATLQGGGGGLVTFNFLNHNNNGFATISNSTIQNNSAVDNPSSGSGGGIALSNDARMVMTNSKVLNNKATQVTASSQKGQGGGIMAFFPNGNFTGNPESIIHSSTISGNKAAGFGGGMQTQARLLIDQGTIISNNVAGTDGTNPVAAQDGGGLYINNFAPASCPPGLTCDATLTHVTITGNSATGNGGGISTGNAGAFPAAGPLTMTFSRLAGNSATGVGSNLKNGGTTVSATDDWWGTDLASSTINTSGGGGTTFDPFVVLTHSATPSKIRINQSTTLTGDMSKDNHGTAVGLANLDKIIGLPITFDNPVLGAIPTAQPEVINASAQATASFNAGGTSGRGSANATVDQAVIGANSDPIASATEAGTTVTITTAGVHNFTTNDTVVISGVGVGGYNGTFPILSTPTSTTFTYTATAGLGASSGGTAKVGIIILAPPSITKSFGAATIPINGTTTVTFSINNANVVAINSSFTDTLPTGLQVASTPGVTNTCGSTVTAAAGTGSISFSNNLTPIGICTITVNVTGTADNNYTNSVQILSTDAGNGNTSSASLTVINPPHIVKAFGATSIPLNGTTSLTFTIDSNSNQNLTLNGVAFTDNLPAGLTNATPSNVSTTCSGGAPTAANGGLSVSLTGASVPPTSSCTVSVTVQGSSAGVKTNSVQVTSTNGGTGNTSSATLNVIAPPTIAKSFLHTATIAGSPTGATEATSTVTITTTAPHGFKIGQTVAIAGVGVAGYNGTFAIASTPTPTTFTYVNAVTGLATSGGGTATVGNSIPLNTTDTLTFTITNPNTIAAGDLTGIAFSDTLPSSTGTLLVAATPNVSNSCNGTVTATGGTGVISLSGGSVLHNASCTLTVDVQGTAAGDAVNTTGATTSTEGGTGTTSNTATLKVVVPPTINKAFGAASIPLNGTTTATFTITNPANNTSAEHGIAFNDLLTNGLQVASTPGVSNTCGGTVTAVANSTGISLSNGTISTPGNTCTVIVNVTGTLPGTVSNTTSVVSSIEGGAGTASNTATLLVIAQPTIAKAFGASTIPLSGTTSLTLTITNPNSVALNGLAFTDNFPAGLVVATPNGLSNNCSGTTTATAGSGVVSLSGGSVASSAQCTISVNVTGTTAGSKLNTTGTIASTEGGTGAASNTATLQVVGPPSLSKSFNPTSIPLNGTSTLTFNVTNPNTNSALSGVAFSDTLTSGLVVAATPSITGSCGAGTITANAGSSSISLSGGTLTASPAAGSSCTFSVDVTGSASGSKNNTTGAITSTEGGTGATSNTATLQVVAHPTISKAFGAANVPLNGTTTLSFTITNPAANGTAENGIAFSDTLTNGLQVASTPGVSNTCTGTVAATANSTSISLSGGSIVTPGNSCAIVVNVTATQNGTVSNTTGAISSTNGGTGATSNTATLAVCSNPATVTNTNNSGAGSLRQSLIDVCDGGTIDFDLGAGPHTITLLSELAITRNVTINNTLGAGNGPVTISGGGTTRVFNLSSGTVNLGNLTVSGGKVTGANGAGLLNSGGTVTLTGMLFTGNTAVNGGGGAIASFGGTLNLYNSTIDGNTATNGGGVYHDTAGTVALINDTITSNTANGDVGGGPVGGGGDSGGVGSLNAVSTTAKNTIIALNSAGTNADSFGVTDSGNNLIGTDPQVAALADNGGASFTRKLQAGSPAIDTGDNTSATNAGLTTDQRGIGFPRILDGDQNATATVDMGAFEATPPPAAPNAPDLDGASDTGPSNSDNYTSVNTPTFTISGVTVGATVELLLDGNPVASGPAAGASIQLTSTTVADGLHTFAARQTVSGDTSVNSTGLEVTIDTTAPAAPTIDLQAGSDSGTSNTDNTTNATTRTFDIGNTEAGATVELLRGGNLVTSSVSAGGTVQLSDSTAFVSGTTYAYTARQTDKSSLSATSLAVNVLIDSTAPTVSSSVRADANPTNAASVNFTVTFSENVAGVDNGDFALTATGVTGASITNISGSNNTRTVTVNTGTGDGTVKLDVSDNDSITDIAGNPLGGTGVGNGSFTAGETYTVSKSAPAADITDVTPDPRNTSVSSITIVFSKAVTGFDLADLSLTRNGGANLLTGAQTLNSADNVTFTLGNLSALTGAEGSYVLTLTAAGSNITDTANNPLAGNATDTWVMDTTAPTLTINQAAGQSDPGSGSTINFTAVFSEPVMGFTNTDVTFSGAGATTATVTEIAPNNGTTYNVAISGMNAAGTVTATISANAAQDAAGNSSAASTSVDNSVTYVLCTSNPIVTTNADSGAGSLRQAIADACDGGTVTFNTGAAVSPITLTSAALLIDKNLTITGPGADQLTVMRSAAGGTPQFRIFNINSGKTVNISGLTINNGNLNGDGGGVLNGGTLTLTNCAVTGNTAGNGGGVTNATGGTLTITGSTISGNTAPQGAGITNAGTLTLINSTVSGNTGDGLSNATGVVANLTNDTFSDNSIRGITSNPGATTNVRNTIVVNIPGATGDVQGPFNSQGNNLIGKSDGSSGFTNGVNNDKIGTVASPLSALLAVLGNYGGPTQTHALLPGSLAIDAGTNCVTDMAHCGDANIPQLTTDQRGLGRQVNGVVDIGACESQGFTIVTTSGTPQSTSINAAFASSLVATVTSAVAEPVTDGQVTFTAPGAGASATFTGGATTINATISGSGQASTSATANATIGGPYNVSAAGSGITGSALFSLTNIKANQTINFGALANKNFGDPDFAVSPTATSGSPVSLAASGNCTVSSPSPGTVHISGAGSCTITASQAGDANYNAAASVPQSFTINKANQTITFNALVNKTFGDPDFAVNATASSGLAVSLAASGNCTVSSPSPGTVHITGASSCTITTSQAGNANFNAAADVPQSFTINKANQTITFAALANKTFGDPDFAVNATASSGLVVSLGATGNCTVTSPSPGTVHIPGAGSCTITATRAGDSNYNPAASVPQSFTINKANQTITFNTLVNKTFGDADFEVTAASSGLAVSLAASGNCTVSSPSPGTVHITGAGSCTITASEGGDANFNAAINVPQSFTIAKAATAAALTSSVNPSDLNQSVIFTATVTSSAGTPTGTVQFKDNGANLGVPVTLNGSGVAQFSTSALATGPHPITAGYSGDGNFGVSTGTLAGGQVVKSQPSLSINDVAIAEGQSGTTVLNFTVTLSAASSLTVTTNFATADVTATAGSDYVATNGVLTFNPGDTSKIIPVTINGDISFEADETFTVNLTGPTNATTARSAGTGTIQNDDAQGGFLSFSQLNYNVNENAGFVTVTITRGNDVTQAAKVDYATDDTGASTNCAALNTGLAAQRCDYTSMFGTLSFAANETQKTIDIPVNLDAFTEGPETFTVNLSNPTGGAVLAAPATATVTINDSASPTPNAIDDTTNFVRQQYHDFLNREADPSGLAFWKNNIDKCNDPAQQAPGQTLAACIEVQRITTSAAFFLSIEFKQTGGMVRDFYVAALNRPATNNTPDFVEFTRDTQAIQKGVVVGQGNWQQLLDANRLAFMNEFVTRAEFVGLYPTTDTPTMYVDKLYQHAAVPPANPGERDAAIAEFGAAATASDPGARGRALLRITQNPTFTAREANPMFVQMQYLGYLRRGPNAPPDSNFNGYNFWLTKLTQFNGDFLQAEMVKAFLSSLEYRGRFGP